jgi:hypothetical protein
VVGQHRWYHASIIGEKTAGRFASIDDRGGAASPDATGRRCLAARRPPARHIRIRSSFSFHTRPAPTQPTFRLLVETTALPIYLLIYLPFVTHRRLQHIAAGVGRAVTSSWRARCDALHRDVRLCCTVLTWNRTFLSSARRKLDACTPLSCRAPPAE